MKVAVILFCLAAAVNAAQNNEKRYLPVQESSESALEGPTTSESTPAATSSESFSWAPTTTAEASSESYSWAPTTTAEASTASESFSWAPTTTDVPAETTSVAHAAPMTPVVESTQTALQMSSTAAPGTMTPDQVQTEKSATALETPSSKSWAYAPSTTEASSTEAAVVPIATSSASKEYTWAPTTASAEAEQTHWSYAPSSSASEVAPVSSAASGNIPNFYQGPTTTPAAGSQTANAPVESSSTPAPVAPSYNNVPIYWTGPPAPKSTTTTSAETILVSAIPAASASEYNKPAISQVALGSTTLLFSGTTTAPTTLATLSLSTQVVCPEDDSSCHTVVVTPRPATATASHVSTDDGILVYNGKTMTIGAATLAAAPTGGNRAAATTGVNGGAIRTGAASKMGMSVFGGLVGVVAAAMMMVL